MALLWKATAMQTNNVIVNPIFNDAAFYPVNLWADKLMDSKQRIQDALIDVIKRKVDDGVLNPPARGQALEGYDLW